MENATRALLIAGGVLIAIIILSVLVITLQRTGNVSRGYDQTVQTEEITIFNSNFTKYLGQDLTIHQVVTIYNFAKSNNVSCNKHYDEDNIKDDLDGITINAEGKRMQNTYKISISYGTDGYVSGISFSDPVKKEV